MAKLAIGSPGLGVLSETFIERHVNLLLPESTCIVSETRKKPFCGHWGSDNPAFIFDEAEDLNEPDFFNKWIGRAFRAMGQRWLGKKEKTLLNFLSHHNVEVFMGEYLDFSLYYLPICKKAGIKFFAHGHGYDVSSKLLDPAWRKRYLEYNSCDGLIVVSEFSKNSLEKIGITCPIHVVPCGIQPGDSKTSYASKGPIKMLSVSRLVSKKGAMITLKAFHQAYKLIGNLELTYIGTGPMEQQMRQYVEENKLHHCVHLPGSLPNEKVKEQMLVSDFFALHSIVCPETGDMEGLPVAILEAMSAGLPVISTKHAGIPEAVSEGENGLLTEENDCDLMTSHIVSLAQNEKLRETMGHNSRKLALEKFSWETEKNRLLHILLQPQWKKD